MPDTDSTLGTVKTALEQLLEELNTVKASVCVLLAFIEVELEEK